jgi:hypothetical protein
VDRTCGTHRGGERCLQGLVGRTVGKRPLGRTRCRRDDNIKMELKETGIDGVNWIRLAQDMVQRWDFVSTAVNPA